MNEEYYKNEIGIQKGFGKKEDERLEFLEKYCKGRGIDIGCGKRAVKGAIGYDIYKKFKPDIVGRAEKLIAFKDKELDFIVSSHCLEHLNDTKKVLKEWDRVLKNGGTMAIIVPDSDFRIKTILEPSHKVAFTKNNIYQLFGHFLEYKIIRCNNPIEMKHNKNKVDILCVAKKRK